MNKQTRKHRWYKGAMISPYSGRAPYGWRWEAHVEGSGFVYAATLAGVKELIRNASA